MHLVAAEADAAVGDAVRALQRDAVGDARGVRDLGDPLRADLEAELVVRRVDRLLRRLDEVDPAEAVVAEVAAEPTADFVPPVEVPYRTKTADEIAAELAAKIEAQIDGEVGNGS